MKARLVGAPYAGRPGPTGAKLYERQNIYRKESRQRADTRRTDVSSPIWTPVFSFKPIFSYVKRTSRVLGRASNLLGMQGLRVTKMQDFDQLIEFSYTLSEVTGPLTQATDATRQALGLHSPPRGKAGVVLENHTVSVPAEGTSQREQVLPPYRFKLNSRLPVGNPIIGLYGLGPIFNAAKSLGKGQLREPHPMRPPIGGLTYDVLKSELGKMLAPGGQTYDSVATA